MVNNTIYKITNHLSFTTDAHSWAFALTHSLFLSLSHMPFSLSLACRTLKHIGTVNTNTLSLSHMQDT